MSLGHCQSIIWEEKCSFSKGNWWEKRTTGCLFLSAYANFLLPTPLQFGPCSAQLVNPKEGEQRNTHTKSPKPKPLTQQLKTLSYSQHIPQEWPQTSLQWENGNSWQVWHAWWPMRKPVAESCQGDCLLWPSMVWIKVMWLCSQYFSQKQQQHIEVWKWV